MDQSFPHPFPQTVACDILTSCATTTEADEVNSSPREFMEPQATTAAAAATSSDIQLPGRTIRSTHREDMAMMTTTESQYCLTASDLVQYTSIDSALRPIEKGNEVVCRPQVKRRTSCTALQLPADDEVQGDHTHQQSTTADSKQCSRAVPRMHFGIIRKRNEVAPEEEEEGGEEEEVEEEEEEEGCVTPTAREQRIPQEISVCPPAPKKRRMLKPSDLKRRPNIYLHRQLISDEVAASNVYHQIHVAEGPDIDQAFVVNPPDLHNFPECIRALFDK